MDVLWLLIFFLPTTISQTGCILHQNHFTHEPADTELKEGEIGSLYCILRNEARISMTCSWYKDGIPVEIQGAYNYFGNHNEGDCSIQITNSTVTRDDGKWTCVRPAHTTNCIQSRNANYRVLKKPKMPSVRLTYDSGKLTNGSQLGLFSNPNERPPTLECRCEGGNPAAKLKFSTSLSTEIIFDTYNFTIGIKGINLTAISVLRLPHIDETWYGQELYCVAEHQLQDQAVYLNIVKPGESQCTSGSLKSSVSYIIIGALLLMMVGAVLGALFLHFCIKRKTNRNTNLGRDSDCERIVNHITSVDENVNSSSKLECVEYSSLAYPKPTKPFKPEPIQQSTQNELCYAELDMKVLNNARVH